MFKHNFIAASALCLSFVVFTSAFAANYGKSTTTYASATLQDAVAKSRAGDFRGAITDLTSITQSQPANADAWNELGFAFRNIKDYGNSSIAYTNALNLNPNHLSALNYQGHMFLETGQTARAVANAQRLAALCGSCNEFVDLRNAISN